MKLLALLFFFTTAHYATAATCTAGESGKIRLASGIYEFCNGFNWMNMKGGDIGNCTAGESGKITFNAGVMQYCNGTDLFSMKGPAAGSCSGTPTGRIYKSGSSMRYCSGTTAYSMNTGPCSYNGSWHPVGDTRDGGTCNCGSQYYICLANGTWQFQSEGCQPDGQQCP
jgi:hypothetical protein